MSVTNSTQSPLASNTSESQLQDRSARVEACPWCCSCISAGTLCLGRRRPRAPTATVCIYSMYSVTVGEDVNGTAKFCVPLAVNLEQFAINSARQQFVSESVQRATKDISSVVDNNEHHPALLGRFVIVAPSINVQTYLLTQTRWKRSKHFSYSYVITTHHHVIDVLIELHFWPSRVPIEFKCCVCWCTKSRGSLRHHTSVTCYRTTCSIARPFCVQPATTTSLSQMFLVVVCHSNSAPLCDYGTHCPLNSRQQNILK